MSTQNMNDNQDINENRAELISGLVDGELDERTADDVITHLEQNNQDRSRWMRYHVISDAMKGHTQSRVDSGFADRVSAAIADEPAILAPRRKSVPAFVKQASGFAVAATIAVVAVLAVQPQTGIETGAQQLVATTEPAEQEWVRVNSKSDGVNWNVQQPAVESKLNAYLVNHNGYTSGVRGILPYAPIVSYDASNLAADAKESTTPVEYKERVEK